MASNHSSVFDPLQVRTYPNPSLSAVSFEIEIDSNTSQARLQIFTVGGRLVRTVDSESLAPGTHGMSWDGQDHSGNQVASGLYLYSLTHGSARATGKITLYVN